MKRILIILALLSIALTTKANAATDYHFDFGPADSAVAEGFTVLDAQTAYTPDRGYGWSAGAPANYTAPKPAPEKTKWWHSDPVHFYDERVNDFRLDGVESPDPFSFKIDLPEGRYRVVLTVGHLNDPLHSIDVYANGELARKKINARLWLFRGLLHKATGNYKRVRFSVDVADQGLTLDFKGDDAEFHRLMEIEKNLTPDERPQSRLKGAPLGPDMAPFQDIGGPFDKISLMGLEVFPEVEMPIVLDPETSKIAYSGSNAQSQQAVEAFNAGNFEEAEAKFLANLSDPLAKGIGLLALAGRADYENEFENVEAAISALRTALLEGNKLNPSGHMATVNELLENAEILLNGLSIFKVRGIPPANGPVWTWRATGEMDQFQPDDFLYWKAQTLEARYMIMLDAHQWCWCSVEGKNKLREVEKRFPNNRYVQFYLYNSLASSEDWMSPDYLAKAKGAPEWAAGLYAGYNHLVDIAEWWAINKQADDGSIGGGWGDDVELVGFFGFIARVSRGASPQTLAMVRNLMNGVYASGQIDEVGGFYFNAGDTEHSAEWTGKTLPMMLSVDFGNPLWVERALQSAKLMKDMWMGVNERGHLHWRSNFLGASGIGGGGTELDSAINWRAANPAVAVLRFTQNPSVKKLILHHADSLLEDAMRTDKGKPAGIIPGEVDYETDEIGGRDVETWYDPGDIPASGNYGFEKFHGSRLGVMRLAYDITGDEKYLEPIRLSAAYAKKHGGDLTAKIHKLTPGTPEWIAIVLKGARDVIADLEYDMARRRGEDLRKTDSKAIAKLILPRIEQIRLNMPFATTEAIATDRVGVPGALSLLSLLMGWSPASPVPQLTYENAGRDFAGAVLGGDPTSLTALVYLFAFDGAKGRDIGLVPWKLQLGAKYRAVWGPDNDGDDEMDNEEGQREFTQNQMGQSLDLNLSTNTTYVVKITQTEPTPHAPLFADLAIGNEDVEYHDEWGHLFVTVHNIGAANAEEFEVIVVDKQSGAEMRAVGSALDAPLDLTPKTTRFGFDFEPTEKHHDFEIEVRSLTDQPELTYLNNTLSAGIDFEIE